MFVADFLCQLLKSYVSRRTVQQVGRRSTKLSNPTINNRLTWRWASWQPANEAQDSDSQANSWMVICRTTGVNCFCSFGSAHNWGILFTHSIFLGQKTICLSILIRSCLPWLGKVMRVALTVSDDRYNNSCVMSGSDTFRHSASRFFLCGTHQLEVVHWLVDQGTRGLLTVH